MVICSQAGDCSVVDVRYEAWDGVEVTVVGVVTAGEGGSGVWVRRAG